jgi:demethoxyubiquinone hydroxylase (CLK1/Coq7/Cat5 family)
MDKYWLALVGEAGATGLAKGIYLVRREEKFRRAYENELSHWLYFRKFRRSLLEKPVYLGLLVFGVIVALLGKWAVKRVVNWVEKNAIDFYEKNFVIEGEIKKIYEDEKEHFVE